MLGVFTVSVMSGVFSGYILFLLPVVLVLVLDKMGGPDPASDSHLERTQMGHMGLMRLMGHMSRYRAIGLKQSSTSTKSTTTTNG